MMPSLVTATRMGVSPDAARGERVRREQARRNFLKFCQYVDPRYETPAHVQLVAEKLQQVARFIESGGKEGISRLMIQLPPRHGKALALDTPIPTPDGWKNIGELRVGDKVFDENGNPCEILVVSQIWKDRPVFTVTTDDGDYILADEQHEWSVRMERKRPNVISTKTTQFLYERKTRRATMIPKHGALKLPEKDLLIDPYVLGLWLGDGMSADAAISEGQQDIDFIRRQIELAGYKTSDRATILTFGILGLNVQLRALGLLNNKHIPQDYLRASIDQRKALLQGLIDTDGYVAKDGQIEFCSIIKDLALQVQELVRSLGVKASLIQGKATIDGRYISEKYRVMFYMAEAARLPRRASLCKDGTKQPHHYIHVKPAGVADTICVEVNSPNNLFLCGRSMLPTHNSEMASRKFPAYFLGRKPDSRIILSSYGADLASKHSRAVRDLVMSTRYQALFGGLSSKNEPVELSSDSRSVAAWDLAAPHRGGMVAAGVGGGITGLGADLLILDDLFKNREEGESEARRDFVDDWYKSSAYTRLEPFAAIILFFTRWHPDDQAGKLIQRMVEDPTSDQWEIISLPALALGDYPSDLEAQREKMREGVYLPLSDPLGRKPGEALWPGRFGREWLEAKKANIDVYEFEALYQQMPYLREGGYFKREWFTSVDKGPGKDAIMRIRYWDKAATPGGGDFTAGALVSRDKEGIYYIEHVARGQWSPGERDRRMAEIGKQDYEQSGSFAIWHQQDPGSAGKDSAQSTSAVMAEAGLTARYEPVTGDKEVRAGPLSSAAQAGRVKLVKGTWNEAFLNELTSFPKGRFDDQVDSAASAFNKVRQLRKKKTAMSYEG